MTKTKREGRGRIGANHRVRGDRSPQVSTRTADPRGVWRVPRDSRAHDHHCPKPPRPLKILPAEVEKRTAKKGATITRLPSNLVINLMYASPLERVVPYEAAAEPQLACTWVVPRAWDWVQHVFALGRCLKPWIGLRNKQQKSSQNW